MMANNTEVTRINVTIQTRKYHHKYIAKLAELPFITVHGDTPEEASNKIMRQFAVYYRTFKNDVNEIFDKVGQKSDISELPDQSVRVTELISEGNNEWKEEKKEITIPILN